VYEIKAEQGDADAQNALAVCYGAGKGVSANLAKAVYWWTKAAEQGCVDAQMRLGECFVSGKGVLQDYGKAIEWYKKAAEQGNDIGKKKLDGLLQIEQLIQEASQGNAEAQFKVGYAYGYDNDKTGIPEDIEKSIEWLTKAANQSHKSGLFYLGMAYQYGHSSKNLGKAMELYLKAAKQGCMTSMNSIAEFYYNGEGVTRDYKKAAKWYTKGAKAGDNKSKRDLGRLYEKGHGVKRSYKKAVEWYIKAGDVYGKRQVERFKKTLFGYKRIREE
jgi:TPR repeat protein